MSMMPEPAEVIEARATIRAWELRDGHGAYVDCLANGCRGYQAACWDCDWRGPERLRGPEPLGTPESRAHKNNARKDAADHRRATVPESVVRSVNTVAHATGTSRPA